MDGFIIWVIVTIILCFIVKNRAYKKGLEECDATGFKDGYKLGIDKVEKEIIELGKLPEKEIIYRIKNFSENKS